MKHQRWPSIESFAHVNKYVKQCIEKDYICVMFNTTYVSKIKLHGTNAAVYINVDNEIKAQKRSSFISIENDNCGFAAWVESNKDYFINIKKYIKNNKLVNDKPIVIHGEWFGKGIQKNAACTNINSKEFAVFAIQIKEKEDKDCIYITEPNSIKYILGEGPCLILPYYDEIDINFYDYNSVQLAKNHINNSVIKIEEVDPYIKETFGVEGIGEGLVYFPKTTDYLTAQNVEKFLFKVKGNKHQGSTHKAKDLVPLDIEKLNSYSEFVDKFITEPRLEQGVWEVCNNEYDKKYIGVFLKWIHEDVKKESVAEIELSGIDFKEVNKLLMIKAREWYIKKIYE